MKNKKPPKETKPLPLPKKYVAFSAEDNRAIEAAYQKVLETVEEERGQDSVRRAQSVSKRERTLESRDVLGADLEGAEAEEQELEQGSSVKVPVN